MTHSVKELEGCTITATDGDIGTIDEVLFDDEKWTIRHLVVDTGGWLGGRKVLISPHSVVGANQEDRQVRVNLTKQQIEDSPSIDTETPVSRQHETELNDYYGYPSYWGGPLLWGYAAVPLAVTTPPVEDPVQREVREMIQQSQDPHLRSSQEVIGYDIQATDEAIGHVEDFLFDDRDWSIELMVVDTSNWWPGKQVLISPARIASVDWNDKKVIVKITREEIESSPEYDAQELASHESRGDLYRQFDRPADGRPGPRM